MLLSAGIAAYPVPHAMAAGGRILDGAYRFMKLLLFDFDGVIADSLETYEWTVRECLNRIGQPIVKNRADFLELFEGNFYAEIVRRGVDLEAFLKASPGVLAEVDFDRMRLFPFLLPVLEKLCEENVLVIISSSGSRSIRQVLAGNRFNGCFRAVLGSDFMLSKVDKIAHAMESCKIGVERTYYIGDTAGDIREAKQAGVKAVAVTWGWHSRETLAAAEPDFIAEKPEDLLKI
jgi:phosphoglycolate phosphatase